MNYHLVYNVWDLLGDKEQLLSEEEESRGGDLAM